MAWNDAVVTNAGIALLRQVLSGETLTLDGAAGGTGTVSPASLMAQTALKDKKQTFSIVGMTNVDNGKKINLQVTNIDLDVGYTLNQVGIWAHVGTGKPVLYAILQDSTGITIPSKTQMQDFAMNVYAVVDFSNNATVNLTIDATALVTRADLNEALNSKMSSIETLTAEDALEDPDLFAFYDTNVGENRRTTWANIKSKLKSKLKEFFLAKTGDGKDVTVTFDEATTRTNIGTGEKLSVVFGKIKKWFSDLTDLAFGKCGSVANQALYTTVGGVVTADKLPVEAGGTGSNTAEGARTNLAIKDATVPISDDVATALGLDPASNPQVKDALAKLLELAIGIDNYAFIVTVVNSDGMPLSDVNIDGLRPIFADTATTNENGMAIGISNTKDLTLSITDYIDIPNSSLIVNATAQVTNVIFTVQKFASNYRQITSSGDYKISSNVLALDICLVGGGGGGGGSSCGGGGGGGYVTNVLDIFNPATANIVVGGGGRGYVNSSNSASAGGNTKFNSYTANGGSAANGNTGGVGNGRGGNYDQNGSPGTVREFGDSSRQLYSGGGGGSKSNATMYPGPPNTNYSGGSPYGGDGGQDGKGYGGGGGGWTYGGMTGGNGAGSGYQGVVAVRWRYK